MPLGPRSLEHRLSELERRLDDMRTSQLQSASLGSGGLTIKDGGTIRILDENGDLAATFDVDGITITGDGEVHLDGLLSVNATDDSGSAVISPTSAGVTSLGFAWKTGVDGGGSTRASIYTGYGSSLLRIEGGGGGQQVKLGNSAVSLVGLDPGNEVNVDLDSVIRLRVEDNTNALLVYVNGSLKRVTQGASDSGGSGFRVLRVPN